jgi:phytanoyl-CoA hydroxylase
MPKTSRTCLGSLSRIDNPPFDVSSTSQRHQDVGCNMKNLSHEDSMNFRTLAADANRDFRLPWFMSHDYQNDERYKSLPEDIRSLSDEFMRDGYIVIEGDVEQDLCDLTIRKFQEFTRINADYFDPHRDEYGFLQRVINLHLTLPAIFEIFTSAKRTLALQDALFAGPTSVYTTLYYERGSSQDIHRDTPYFTTRPEYNYFGTWFALEDAHAGNGCLEAIRGGHLIPEIDRQKFARENRGDGIVDAIDPALFDAYQNEVSRLCATEGLEKVKLPLKKGDVLIWHPQLPHGGSPIADRTLTRHSIVAHTVAEGTQVYQAEAFFSPSRSLPGRAEWPLVYRDNRAYADHNCVDVMHVAPRNPSEFLHNDFV